MKFKSLLMLFYFPFLINFVKGLPLSPNLKKRTAGGNLSELFLSNHTLFNYNEIKNLVVFGDSNSCHHYQWPSHLSRIHKMKLWNFAKSGAVVDLNITYRGPGHGLFDLSKEYTFFYLYMALNLKFSVLNDKNTLFAIHLGSNDVYDVYLKKSEYKGRPEYIEYVNNDKSPNENIADIINVMFEQIRKIYSIGGRNFLIFNIPPLDLADVNKVRNKNYKEAITLFNSLLVKESEKLFEEYRDINIIIYNANEEYRYIINNYEEFDFISGTQIYKLCEKLCEISFNKYFWNDHTHITEKGNRIIANSINELLKSLNK